MGFILSHGHPSLGRSRVSQYVDFPYPSIIPWNHHWTTIKPPICCSIFGHRGMAWQIRPILGSEGSQVLRWSDEHQSHPCRFDGFQKRGPSGNMWTWYLGVGDIGNHILDSDGFGANSCPSPFSQWDCRYSPTKEMFVWTCLAPLWWLINMNHHYSCKFWWSSPFSDTLICTGNDWRQNTWKILEVFTIFTTGGKTSTYCLLKLLIYLGYDVET